METMKNTCYNKLDNFLLSAKQNSLSFIKFQLVYQFKGEKKFIRSVNFLYGNKILKKIYLKELLVSDEKMDIESFITEMLLKDRETPESKLKCNHNKTNQDARTQAAANLFSNLGI